MGEFDSNHEFVVRLRSLIDKNYKNILEQQLFENGMVEDIHCLIALMQFDLQSDAVDNSLYGVIVPANASLNAEDESSYDLLMGVVCLLVIIALVGLIFGYWCHYYPKQQRQRNEHAFWCRKQSENDLQSGTSDFDGYID